MNKTIPPLLAALPLCFGCAPVDDVTAPVDEPSARDVAPLVTQLSMDVAYSAMPVELRRRVVDHLWRMGEQGVVPGWRTAFPSARVRPLYRPDLGDAVAYYEVPIVVGPTPVGHIVVTHGTHDHPIASWSGSGETPTATLLDRVAPADVARFYRLDARTTVAENRYGVMLASTDAVRTRQGAPYNGAWWGYKDAYATEFRDVIATLRHEPYPVDATPALLVGPWRTVVPLPQGNETFALVGLPFVTVTRIVLPNGRGALEVRPIAGAYGPDTATFSPMATLVVSSAPLWSGTPYSEVFSVVLAPRGIDRDADAQNGAEQAIEAVDVPAPRGRHPRYWQFNVSQVAGSNTEVGCGPVAWSTLLSWYDQMADHDPRYAARGWGNTFERSTQATDSALTSCSLPTSWPGYALTRLPAPSLFNNIAGDAGDDLVRSITRELRCDLGTTSVATAASFTLPLNMGRVRSYLARRGLAYNGSTGVAVTSLYNSLLHAEDDLRYEAIHHMHRNREPVVVGFDTHYAVAVGYRHRAERYVSGGVVRTRLVDRSFRVLSGWASNPEVWIPADIWYVGRLDHHDGTNNRLLNVTHDMCRDGKPLVFTDPSPTVSVGVGASASFNVSSPIVRFCCHSRGVNGCTEDNDWDQSVCPAGTRSVTVSRHATEGRFTVHCYGR